ncbi:exonuclease V [Aplochiton taeniatus]
MTSIPSKSFNKLKREHIPKLSVPIKTPMERFFKKHLQVTKLCDQNWCEIKMVYGFIRPRERRLEMQRAVVTTGTSIHIARELEDQLDAVTVPVFTREDREATKLLNMLQKIQHLQAGKRVREFPVFGMLEGVFLSGIVDELCLNEAGELVLSELKTRCQRSAPGPAQARGHALQVGVYRLLLESMMAGELKSEQYTQPLGLRSQRALSGSIQEVAEARHVPSSTLGQLLHHLLGALASCKLPRGDVKLRVEYLHQSSGDLIGVTEVAFQEAQLRSEVKGHLAYWKGEREPRGVDIEDSWKCTICPYEDACEWRKDQDVTAGTEKNKRAKLIDLQ